MLTTDLGGTIVGRYHGSSEATAVVSGAAALMLSYKPELTATELSAILLHSTDDILAPGRDISSGHGFLNLEKAVPLLTQ
jgi:subtilisin family serine protease